MTSPMTEETRPFQLSQRQHPSSIGQLDKTNHHGDCSFQTLSTTSEKHRGKRNLYHLVFIQQPITKMYRAKNPKATKISACRSFRNLKSSEELGQALRELNSAVRGEGLPQLPSIPKSRPTLISFKSQSTLSTKQESDRSLVGFRDLSNGLQLDQLKELALITIPKETGRSFASPQVLNRCESLQDEELAIVADWLVAISCKCDLSIRTKHLAQRFVGLIRQNHGEYEASDKAFLSAAWISQRSLHVPSE